MEQVTLSIIVCTYNRAEMLKQSLPCILEQQTSFPFEVVIGDDCSTDNTPEVLAQFDLLYPNKIRVIRQEANLGLGGNWAASLLQARGKYVAFLDDDDRWTDNHRMQIMVEYMELHSDVDVLYTNGYTVYERTGIRNLVSYTSPENLDFHEIWKGKQLSMQMNMVMVKKEAITERINLEDYIRLRFPIQDWNTHILMLGKNARYAYMDLPSCILNIADGSMSRPKTYEEVENKYKKRVSDVQLLGRPIPKRFRNTPR